MFGGLFGSTDSNVFDDFRRLEQEMDRFFNGGSRPTGIRAVRRGTFPPINVAATPERIDVYLFAAGLDPNDIELSIQQNLLSISGSRAPRDGGDQNVTWFRRERFAGDFRRVITLPEDADPDRVEAKYRDGVLQVTVQRRESARPRQITVN